MGIFFAAFFQGLYPWPDWNWISKDWNCLEYHFHDMLQYHVSQVEKSAELIFATTAAVKFLSAV